MKQRDEHKCVVITGSSKGIGYALAKAFLAQSFNVVISGRSQDQLTLAFQQLTTEYGDAHIEQVQCDVSDQAALERLWHVAIQRFSKVDIWINNAGSSTTMLDLKDIPSTEIESTVKTNILGTILGSQVALQHMIHQGDGQIFNMEGWGSRGEWSAGMTVYSTTKYATAYFSKALYKEAKGVKIQVGTLSPGMVATDLLVSSWSNGNVQHWKKMKRLFFFVIDPPEVVCSYLVHKMIKNRKAKTRIVWMTPLRLFFRLFQPYYWRRNPVQNTDLEHL